MPTAFIARVRPLLALLGVLALPVLPRDAASQSSDGSEPPPPRFGAFVGQDPSTPACGSGPLVPFSYTNGQGQTRLGCTAAAVQLEGFGRAFQGVVGTSASTRLDQLSNLTPDDIPPEGVDPLSAEGLGFGAGRWGDRLTFSGGSATMLDISLSWTGSLAAVAYANGDASSSSNAFAQWGFHAVGPDSVDLIDPYDREREVSATVDVFSDGFEDSQFASIADIETFHISLVGSTGLLSYVDLIYYVSSYAAINASVGRATGEASGRAASDMNHTAVVTGVVFRDAAGRDVTSGVNYAFANGLLITPVTTTPEPTSVVLAGAGLAGLALIRRRRRKV